eukprot:m.478093 g.478093  ORF g.478093 m.478093 type:complete len:53 (-) comp45586_c0_seq1:175-333(-)
MASSSDREVTTPRGRGTQHRKCTHGLSYGSDYPEKRDLTYFDPRGDSVCLTS